VTKEGGGGYINGEREEGRATGRHCRHLRFRRGGGRGRGSGFLKYRRYPALENKRDSLRGGLVRSKGKRLTQFREKRISARDERRLKRESP